MSLLNVAQAIRGYLVSHGIRQTFVAEKCGWPKQKVNAIVCGKKKMTADEMAIICNAIGVPYDFFYNIADSNRISA